jgi:aspartyl-tRNA(Asn)/glutamyl-tRNA(Gln) amidotransferase subunit B
VTRIADPRQMMKGATGDWEIVVGMEVHAQVTSKSKLFSAASTKFGGAPNSHVSLVDAAMPGMLPVINEYCVAQAVRTGLGLNAKINLKSRFDRKNYFYPDLPQGYQISQYQMPVVGEGAVTATADAGEFTVGIERLHLEQDAGKSLHDQHATLSYVDLNRSGVALMEIVSKPDIRSADEAKAYLTKLRALLRHLGTCNGDMEKGALRADVNVSVRRPGEPLGTRCEIKNMNSIRFIGEAVDYEARRQIEILEEGGTIDQETRLFDPRKGETRAMRTKEEAHDYRYFPDPDLLPLELDQAWVDNIALDLPELPDAQRSRYVASFGLSPVDAGILVAHPASAAYFEKMVKYGTPPIAAANWLINELLPRAAALRDAVDDAAEGQGDGSLGPVDAEANSAIVKMFSDGVISSATAKRVLDHVMAHPDVDPRAYVEQQGLAQVNDTGALEKLVSEVLAANPDKVDDAKAKPAALGWFVGQVMKASGGKANPQAVNALLKAKLGL